MDDQDLQPTSSGVFEIHLNSQEDRDISRIYKKTLKQQQQADLSNCFIIGDSEKSEENDEESDEVEIIEQDTSVNERCSMNLDESDKNQIEAPELHEINSCNNKIELSEPKFYCLQNRVVVLMKPYAMFSFSGKLKIKVLRGTIQIYGFEISEMASAEVFSPRGHNTVVIENTGKPSKFNKTDIPDLLCSEGIEEEEVNKYIEMDFMNQEPGTAIFILRNLENELTKFLSVFYPLRLFPRIEDSRIYSWIDPKLAEVTLQCNFHFELSFKQLLYDSERINKIKDKMLNLCANNKWLCTILTGGKGTGKSTTSRFLINNMLKTSNVVLVDLDPGQTELTPSKCISYSVISKPLLGPNFTHVSTPNYQLFVGDENVANCVVRYIKCVEILMKKISSCPILSKLPIIVNTMGFCKNIGWGIAVFIIKLFQPSLVVQILSRTSNNNFDKLLKKEVINKQEKEWYLPLLEVDIDWFKHCDYELEVIQSLAEHTSSSKSGKWNIEPYQRRNLMMIAYFSQLIKDNINIFNESLVRSSITSAVPYTAPFSSLYISLSKDSVPSRALSVINANIVALCGIDPDNLPKPTQEEHDLPIILTRPPICTCYGFGIVRGVDMNTALIYILTPLPQVTMRYVNCLMGCIPIPETLLQLDNPKAPYVGVTATVPTSRQHRRGCLRTKSQWNKSKTKNNK